ncbi:MAG: hypothetical protein K6F49_10945 [Saccharofermentans sp.]|nr:hypothetical protein [Saccharofermentans sp.]
MGLFDMFSKAKGNSEEKANELISKAPVGQAATELSSQFSCADVFTIEPKPLDVGIPRAKALKGRVVVLGRIKGGEFAKGDAVAIVKNGTVSAHTKILDLIPYEDGLIFDTELNANIHKTKASFDSEAWLILDVTDGVGPGDIIGKV